MEQHPPSVDKLALSLADLDLPHPLLVDVARKAIAADEPDSARHRGEALARTLLQPVVNATGVLLHTNMGRAPHFMPVGETNVGANAQYSNLELNLATGQRGSRQTQAGALFARLCDAEDAMIVNNCAAAVTLTLAALAAGRGVAVSRGELVEIGGGFRIPEVMAQSGARLVEVGTTNRTRPADFEAAVASDNDVALALKVHQSNYKIVGFTEEARVEQIRHLGVPIVADIGSGLLDAACSWLPTAPPTWLADEPAAKQTLAAGADLVMFSGDKLLGGPQAGIIAGRRDLVAKCKRHPLARAFRPGGLVLGQLQQLALAYLDRRGHDIPFWRMASLSVDELQRRADELVASLGAAAPTGLDTVPMMSVPGGGTLPTVDIPSYGLSIPGDHSEQLRSGATGLPIVARVTEQTTWIDLRTIDPSQDALVAKALAAISSNGEA